MWGQLLEWSEQDERTNERKSKMQGQLPELISVGTDPRTVRTLECEAHNDRH
jgi:hypothetical protein